MLRSYLGKGIHAMDQEAWEYFEKHKRQAVNIALPEREESESNITEKQIGFNFSRNHIFIMK